jgi:hypothetical protein
MSPNKRGKAGKAVQSLWFESPTPGDEGEGLLRGLKMRGDGMERARALEMLAFMRFATSLYRRTGSNMPSSSPRVNLYRIIAAAVGGGIMTGRGGDDTGGSISAAFLERAGGGCDWLEDFECHIRVSKKDGSRVLSKVLSAAGLI